MSDLEQRTPNIADMTAPSPKMHLDSQSRHDRRVEHAVEVLFQRMSTADLTISDIAEAVHLSTSRLRHLFRKELGISPHQYLKYVRLLYARHLLRNTFLEVKEVMVAAGFADPSHFTRIFKQTFHETPSDTRRRERRNGQ